MHIDPHTLVQDSVTQFIRLFISEHLASRHLSPESLLLNFDYLSAAMSVL